MRNLRTFAYVSLLGALAPAAAQAATFDSRGVLAFDSRAVATNAFEGIEEQTGVALKQDATALQGAGYASITTNGFRMVSFPVAVPAAKARYRATIWARKNRIVADLDVEYADSGAPGVSARFFPTGRVTSDGWYEVATAPFSVDGTRKPSVAFAVFASGADVDALELIEDGDFRPTATCEGRATTTCGEGEFCAAGYCRDGAAGVPALPGEAERTRLANYLGWRMKAFYGGRHSRANGLPRAIAAINAGKSAKTSWAYWNAYATAIHRLGDWHTKISGAVDVTGRGAFPICVDEGVADASYAVAPATPGLPDVLVTKVGPEGNSGLKVGDRIVAIDGVHPVTWAESFDDLYWGYWHSNDPAGHAEGLENLRFLVRRWAKELTIVRCDPQTGQCGTLERLKASDLPKSEPQGYPQCDHRPFVHLVNGESPSGNPHSGDGIAIDRITQNAPGENVYAMVWDSVYLTDPDDNPYAAPLNTLRQNASGVILDHRTGNGGTEPAAEFLTTLFRKPAFLGVASAFNGTVGFFDAPYTQADGAALVQKRGGGDDGFNVGAPNARDTMRTAVLLARDGSASDWWPHGMKDGGANIRLFGRRTAGAFSSFFQFDYYGMLSWQFGSGDYVRANGTTHLGEGVLPDEDLMPKQSDLLAGRDTVFLRALEWVRTGQ
jgi:hypothetical protein